MPQGSLKVIVSCATSHSRGSLSNKDSDGNVSFPPNASSNWSDFQMAVESNHAIALVLVSVGFLHD